MSGHRKRRAGTSERQRAWYASAQFRMVQREASRQAAAAPKCGAKRKGDGQPCQNPGLENGRCRLHGGLTPKGDRWHVPRWPRAGAPAEKFDKKRRELDRRRERLAARVAAMTPAEREAYERRSRGARPGTPAERAQRQHDREARKLFAALEAAPPRKQSAEAQALAAEIARLEARRAELKGSGK
jgi:hypothetical protein